MFCTDICNKQPLGEVLHSVKNCFVTGLIKNLLVYNIEPRETKGIIDKKW